MSFHRYRDLVARNFRIGDDHIAAIAPAQDRAGSIQREPQDFFTSAKEHQLRHGTPPERAYCKSLARIEGWSGEEPGDFRHAELGILFVRGKHRETTPNDSQPFHEIWIHFELEIDVWLRVIQPLRQGQRPGGQKLQVVALALKFLDLAHPPVELDPSLHVPNRDPGQFKRRRLSHNWDGDCATLDQQLVQFQNEGPARLRQVRFASIWTSRLGNLQSEMTIDTAREVQAGEALHPWIGGIDLAEIDGHRRASNPTEDTGHRPSQSCGPEG